MTSHIFDANNQLLPQNTVTALVAHRDAAIAKMRNAAELIAKGHTLADEASNIAQKAYGAATFTLADRSQTAAYSRLFNTRFDSEESLSVYRQQVDSRVWMHLMTLTGMENMMDRTARDKFYEELCGTVPEVTEENVWQVLEGLKADAHLIFQRGLARAFSDLDRRFKSHNAFKFGSRVVLTQVFNDWGSWNYHSRTRETLADVERVFAILDQKAPDPKSLERAIDADRSGGFSPRQSVTETPYFRARTFKNGNCHLWFLREDLVEKANLVLADYYGEVLPDSVPEDTPEDALRSDSGALSRDLAFYPTPTKVVVEILRNTGINKDSVVLEPSAGVGNMAKVLLERGAAVTAIEVAPSRYEALLTLSGKSKGLRVIRANFLRMIPTAKFTHVVMNPPFYGTHWMQHVVHAFDFLAPGGTLIAVLPISADLGQSKKHLAFRKWTQKHGHSYISSFRDLPAESFAESGTRVSTVVLTLYRD